MLFDSGRFAGPHPIGPNDAVPAIPRARTPARLISELNDTASVSAVYASSGALLRPHARLASGRWLAFAGRASNPLDSNEKFQSATSDILLSQAYPGATECKSSVVVIGITEAPITAPATHHGHRPVGSLQLAGLSAVYVYGHRPTIARASGMPIPTTNPSSIIAPIRSNARRIPLRW